MPGEHTPNDGGQVRFAPRLVIFDLDGTLIDTAPDLALSIDQMLRSVGSAECGEGAVRMWIGSGIEKLVKRALTHATGRVPDPREFEEGLAIFESRYHTNNGSRSQLYAGVTELLQELREQDVQLACVTNKSGVFTEQLLQIFQLGGQLRVVVSGDAVERKKPDPQPLLHACRLAGVEPLEALMVGDSRNDILAARAAGMPVVVVSYGYNRGESLAEYGPDLIIDCLAELKGHLDPPGSAHRAKR